MAPAKQAGTHAATATGAQFVYRKNADSIVTVETIDESGTYLGSGVAFRNGQSENPDKTSDKKYIFSNTWFVTNAHVVRKAKEVNIVTDGQTSKARVAYWDDTLDVALLCAEGLVISPVEEPSNALTLVAGDPVYAIGAPMGLPRTITEGVVKAIRNSGDAKLMELSAAISRSNSGGGLFDQQGRLVGITNFKIVGGKSLNFALAANHVIELIDALGVALVMRITAEGYESQLAGDVFVKWLLTERGDSGVRLFKEYADVRERLRARTKTLNGIETLAEYGKHKEYELSVIRRYLATTSGRGAAASAGSSIGKVENANAAPSITRLICRLIDFKGVQSGTTSYVIDFDSQTVNGYPATFGDSKIQFVSLGNDGTRTIYSLDRIASTHTIGSDQYVLFRGDCSRVESRAF